MDNKTKRKLVLRKDDRDKLKKEHPEMFEYKDMPVKIRLDNPFIKLMHINKSYYDAIIEEL
jgi:hypothetical protein